MESFLIYLWKKEDKRRYKIFLNKRKKSVDFSEYFQGWKKKSKFVWDPRFKGENPRNTLRRPFMISHINSEKKFFFQNFFDFFSPKVFFWTILKKIFPNKNRDKNFFLFPSLGSFLLFTPKLLCGFFNEKINLNIFKFYQGLTKKYTSKTEMWKIYFDSKPKIILKQSKRF